ncbi:MAG: hypothetical protein PUK16_02065 [Prevotellaceae bacterium]|nr:hypothetical protein [Prevotella sp.]MDD7529726.1 hypothetical protein [Prevotellaceae bacterium]MDY2634700.1 hypothetical protein [Prevotella sp.]
MIYLVFLLIGAGFIAAVFGWISSRKEQEAPIVQSTTSCDTCNGDNGKCEQLCMMEAAIKEIEYYNDEELDKFVGRKADDYDEEEIEEFAEVLHTMRPNEISEWCRSLTLRHIELPNTLKDEIIMMREG